MSCDGTGSCDHAPCPHEADPNVVAVVADRARYLIDITYHPRREALGERGYTVGCTLREPAGLAYRACSLGRYDDLHEATRFAERIDSLFADLADT